MARRLRRRPFLLDPDPRAPFPPVSLALRSPDGLLGVGGDLHPDRLRTAYGGGVFPWPMDDAPLLWWTPAERTVFPLGREAPVHLSTRFRRDLRRSDWTVTTDTDFPAVIDACARTARKGEDGTWITPEMVEAYTLLHAQGDAHSVEVRDGAGTLVGGLYGVAVGSGPGAVFCGESMVSLASGGSKVALAGLARTLAGWGFALLDAQMHTDHLESLGAIAMHREHFCRVVGAAAQGPARPGPWTERFGTFAARDLA